LSKVFILADLTGIFFFLFSTELATTMQLWRATRMIEKPQGKEEMLSCLAVCFLLQLHLSKILSSKHSGIFFQCNFRPIILDLLFEFLMETLVVQQLGYHLMGCWQTVVPRTRNREQYKKRKATCVAKNFHGSSLRQQAKQFSLCCESAKT
jgi:hypothetical protein